MDFLVQRFWLLLPLFFRGGSGAYVLHHLAQVLALLFLFDSGGVLEFKTGFRDIIVGGGHGFKEKNNNERQIRSQIEAQHARRQKLRSLERRLRRCS
uniref:Putative secreted protein n=1 Tax=Ixodes ricinus TaxID=34613 RepID=A0A6B0UEV7_IXORI